MALKQVDQPTIEDTYWPPPQGEWTYSEYWPADPEGLAPCSVSIY